MYIVSALRLETSRIFRFLHCKGICEKLPVILTDEIILGVERLVQDTLDQDETYCEIFCL